MYCLYDARTGRELYYQGTQGVPDGEHQETCVFKISHEEEGVCVCAVCNGRIGEGDRECDVCDGAFEDYIERGVFLVHLAPFMIPSQRNALESDNDDPEAPDYSGEFVLHENASREPHPYYTDIIAYTPTPTPTTPLATTTPRKSPSKTVSFSSNPVATIAAIPKRVPRTYVSIPTTAQAGASTPYTRVPSSLLNMPYRSPFQMSDPQSVVSTLKGSYSLPAVDVDEDRVDHDTSCSYDDDGYDDHDGNVPVKSSSSCSTAFGDEGPLVFDAAKDRFHNDGRSSYPMATSRGGDVDDEQMNDDEEENGDEGGNGYDYHARERYDDEDDDGGARHGGYYSPDPGVRVSRPAYTPRYYSNPRGGDFSQKPRFYQNDSYY